jgi:hypothetical protein
VARVDCEAVTFETSERIKQMALNSSSLNCGKLLRSVFTVAIIGGVLASAAVGDAQTTTTLNASKDNTLYEDTGGQISNGQGPHAVGLSCGAA